jgi:hypothetical protein
MYLKLNRQAPKKPNPPAPFPTREGGGEAPPRHGEGALV